MPCMRISCMYTIYANVTHAKCHACMYTDSACTRIVARTHAYGYARIHMCLHAASCTLRLLLHNARCTMHAARCTMRAACCMLLHDSSRPFHHAFSYCFISMIHHTSLEEEGVSCRFLSACRRSVHSSITIHIDNCAHVCARWGWGVPFFYLVGPMSSLSMQVWLASSAPSTIEEMGPPHRSDL